MEQIYTTLEEREIMVWNLVSKKKLFAKNDRKPFK